MSKPSTPPFNADKSDSRDKSAKGEQRDYYFNEQGLMVMTAAYHLRRGYCCGNGCKHCPYSKKG